MCYCAQCAANFSLGKEVEFQRRRSASDLQRAPDSVVATKPIFRGETRSERNGFEESSLSDDDRRRRNPWQPVDDRRRSSPTYAPVPSPDVEFCTNCSAAVDHCKFTSTSCDCGTSDVSKKTSECHCLDCVFPYVPVYGGAAFGSNLSGTRLQPQNRKCLLQILIYLFTKRKFLKRKPVLAQISAAICG